MKIGILGSDSFVGKSLHSKLVEYAVTGFSRSNKTAIPNWQEFNYPNQLPDPNNLLKFDVLIYCAGAGIQSNNKQTEEEIMNLNYHYPKKLISNLLANNWKGKWISFGSYLEYGTNHNSLKTEQELLNETNITNSFYGKSKRALSSFITGYKDDNILHIIIPNVYGSGENTQRLIPYLLGNLKKNRPLKLSNRNKKRQYLHINDLIQFITYSIEHKISGTYNCGPKTHHSIQDLVDIALELVPRSTSKITFNDTLSHDQGILFLGMSNEKISSLRWNPEVELMDGMKDYLNLDYE